MTSNFLTWMCAGKPFSSGLLLSLHLLSCLSRQLCLSTQHCWNSWKQTGESVTVKVLSIPDWLKNLQLTDEDTFIFKIDIEGAEYAILDALLSDDDDNILCLVDLFKMEFHPKQVRKIAALDDKYETFGDDFPRLFKEKCGRDAKIYELF